MLAAVIVVAVVLALFLPNRKHYSSMPPANGPGTLVVLRAHTKGLSTADLKKARQVVRARAVALGATDPDVRIVGPDEIAAFLPGVSAGSVGALGIVDAYQVRPFIIEWTLAPKWPMSVPVIPDPPVIDQWKSLGFAPPKDATAYAALSKDQQQAIRAVITNWNCSDKPLDRPDEPIVVCDPLANKYLLGPRVMSSDDVQSAWFDPSLIGKKHTYVKISLTDAGHLRWKAFAAQHTFAVYPGDYGHVFATMLDDVVADRSDDLGGNGDSVLATGFVTQKVDQGLAANLTGGALPAPFDMISIKGQ